MVIKSRDLRVKHKRISNPNSSKWDLSPIAFERGSKASSKEIILKTRYYQDDDSVIHHKMETASLLKYHAETLIDSGSSVTSVGGALNDIKRFFSYFYENQYGIHNVENIRQAIFDYSEHQFARASLRKIKHQSAYQLIGSISHFLNGVFEDLQFEIGQTRLKKESKPLRALSREADKVILSEAHRLAKFCFDITQNFDPSMLRSGYLPIIIQANNQEINLTLGRKKLLKVDADFKQTSAYLAFNLRVTAEVFMFLGMTVQKQAPAYNLKRSTFAYKSLGDTYEVREYKNRRGGDVLFKIPRPYKFYFEKYLSFLDEYAPDSEWLFPHLEKFKGFRKRTDIETSKFKRFCLRYKIPWVKPSAFRKIGENILMRLASDEKTASDYANHAVSTFRQHYEFPSLQRAMIEIGRFWNGNDPLTHGKPKVSLFNSPCNGIPLSIDDEKHDLPKPDCITPTGCIGCKHYRDEDSFEYVWGLYSFKFLKIIESSSHHTKQHKPSTIAIEWVNLKMSWFENSENTQHQEWVEEAAMKIEEGDYHPTWSRKIEKFKG